MKKKTILYIGIGLIVGTLVIMMAQDLFIEHYRNPDIINV